MWFKEEKQFMSNLMSPSCHHLHLHGTVVKDRVLEMVPPFYHPDMLLMSLLASYKVEPMRKDDQIRA